MLFLDRQVVTVSDGQLNISSDGQDPLYCYIEVVSLEDPAALTCNNMIAAGLNPLADVNNDCYVDLGDFLFLADSWYQCNDPCTINCPPLAP